MMRIASGRRERSVLRDVTWGILPVIFFLHFIITGTIVLVYTLYIHDTIPQNYAIGAAITFGCILALLALGHLILYYRKPLRPPSDLDILSASGSNKSTVGKKIKDWYYDLRLFLQRYGDHQRRYVREFTDKKKQKRRASRGSLGGFIPVKELSVLQLLKKKSFELVDELKRRRQRRRAGVVTRRKPAGNQNGSSRNKQVATNNLPHISAAPDALRREVKFEDLEGGGNTVSLSQHSHSDTSKGVFSEVEGNTRARTGRELEGDSIPDNAYEKTLKQSYQHPTVEEYIVSPPNAKRKPSVLPEDVLIEEHPPPRNYQSEQRAYSYSQTSDASGHGHSTPGDGITAQRFPGSGNAIKRPPPVLTHQQQGFNRLATSGLSQNGVTTAEALVPLPMKSADMIQPLRVLKQTQKSPSNDLTTPSDDLRTSFDVDYGKTLDELTRVLSNSQPANVPPTRSKSKSFGRGSTGYASPPAKKTSRASTKPQNHPLYLPFPAHEKTIPAQLPVFPLRNLSPLNIDFNCSRSPDTRSVWNGRKPAPTDNSSHKDII